MKSKHLQPVTIAMVIFAGILLARFVLPKDAKGYGVMQSGSMPNYAGTIGSTSGSNENLRGQM
jgi:hypothetical protein